MWRTLRTLPGLGAVLVACDVPLEVLDPAPFDPPPSYLVWWAELEACVGLEGDFAEIEWYTGESLLVEGRDAFGIWLEPNLIIIERFYTTSEPAVKHEMLHHLSGGAMPHGHRAFRRCTGVQSHGPPQAIVAALPGG